MPAVAQLRLRAAPQPQFTVPQQAGPRTQRRLAGRQPGGGRRRWDAQRRYSTSCGWWRARHTPAGSWRCRSYRWAGRCAVCCAAPHLQRHQGFLRAAAAWPLSAASFWQCLLPNRCIMTSHPHSCNSNHLQSRFSIVQLPVFVTAMWATRRMAAAPWPGLSEGGALWFPDLTLPAVDLSTQVVQVGVRAQVVKPSLMATGSSPACPLPQDL